MTFYRRLRLAYGLRWQSNRPPMPYRHILIVALCVATYGVVAKVDNLEARSEAMEAKAASNSAYAKTLFDCMSAGANDERGGFYFPDTQKAYECRVSQL